MTKSRTSGKSRTRNHEVDPIEEGPYDVYMRLRVARAARTRLEELLEAIRALLEEYESSVTSEVDSAAPHAEDPSARRDDDPVDEEDADYGYDGKRLN